MPDFAIIDPAFRALVLPNAPLETLGTGYRWLEGPVWFADHDCLYVSDLPDDRLLRWNEDGGVSVARAHVGFADGHARDRAGRLLTCSHRNRAVTRTEPDGNMTVLASHYRGRRINSPTTSSANRTERSGSAIRSTESAPITRAASSRASFPPRSTGSIPPPMT